MYRKYIIPMITVLLLVSSAVAQDSSQIGVEKDNRWEYLVEKDTAADFKISAGSDGAVAEGDTYTFTITSDIDSDGSYTFEYENDNVKAQGDDSLSDFGADPNAVYTDWNYWETNIEKTDAFSGLTGVTVDNGADIFKASYDDGSVLKLIVEYYKTPGVIKRVEVKSYVTNDELIIVNQTGSEADDAPGFNIVITISGLAMISLVIKKRRNL